METIHLEHNQPSSMDAGQEDKIEKKYWIKVLSLFLSLPFFSSFFLTSCLSILRHCEMLQEKK